MKKLVAVLMTASALALLAPAAALAGNGKGNNGNGNGNGGSNGSPGNNGNGKGGGNTGSNGGSGSTGSSGSNGSSGSTGTPGSNGNGNGNGGGNTIAVLNGPCVLTVGSYCDFSGNINLNNKLADIDTAYNAQLPAGGTPLDLSSLNQAEQDTGFSNPDSGTVTSTFLVTYYAVKAGDEFRLFEIAPSYTFNWTTAGMTNGGGQQPAVSHVIWIDPPTGFNLPPGIPEPATWGLMILGFGGAGAMLRQRRKLQARAAA